jgi:hypothetical protein
LKTNPSAGFEEAVEAFPKAFPGTILVPTEEEALKQAGYRSFTIARFTQLRSLPVEGQGYIADAQCLQHCVVVCRPELDVVLAITLPF